MKTYIIPIVTFFAGAIAWYGIAPLFNPLVTNEAAPTDVMNKTDGDAMMKHDGEAMTGSSTDKSGEAMMSHERSGVIVGTAAHPASGTVKIVSSGGKNFIRYENLKTINGPDIYVYLANDLGAKDYVKIAKVKSTEGSSNYEIPSTVDANKYKYVLIWCEQFGVLFNSAELKG